METNTIPSKAAIRDARRLEALNLRLSGKSYRTIAATLKCTLPTAFNDVKIMLKEYASEPADAVRNAEIARLDRLMLAHWPEAIKGKIEPTRMVLEIMRRRAALLGLDAPKKIDITTWIREMAIAEGLDPDQAAADADAFVRGLPA